MCYINMKNHTHTHTHTQHYTQYTRARVYINSHIKIYCTFA